MLYNVCNMELSRKNIISYLKQTPGASASEMGSVFKKGRTSIIYQLKYLLDEKLVTKKVESRVSRYYVGDAKSISKFYEREIKELQDELTSVIEVKSTNRKGKRMKLAFVNYFDLLPESVQKLEKYYEIADFSDKELFITKDELIYRGKDADVIVNNWGCDVDKYVVDSLPTLKYMHASTAMTIYIDEDALQKRGIHLSNIPESYRSIALEEFLLAQTFTLLRNAYISGSQFKAGVLEFRQFMGEQIRGKTIGIIGYSTFVQNFINMMKNLGVEVLMYNEREGREPDEVGLAKFSSIQDVVDKADILYWLHSADEDSYIKYRLNDALLDLIKKPIYLISIGKYEDSNIEKIRKLIYAGLIKGIAIDASFSGKAVEEAKRIAYLPNVLLTPDVSWYTTKSVENLNYHTVERLIAYARGDLSLMLY